MYPAGIRDVFCSGVEPNILECIHVNTTTDACTPDSFATVACRGKASLERQVVYICHCQSVDASTNW